MIILYCENNLSVELFQEKIIFYQSFHIYFINFLKCVFIIKYDIVPIILNSVNVSTYN